MRAVEHDGQRPRAAAEREPLHAPDETRPRTRIAVEERGADRRAGRGPHALAAQRVEDGAGEAGVGVLDRRALAGVAHDDRTPEREGVLGDNAAGLVAGRRGSSRRPRRA